MPHGKTILCSLLITLAVWMLLSWPLPRHFLSAIPASAHNTEAQAVRTMVPGDHLQLLYNFWLFSDMLRGRTPFFHNLYEFNSGDDAKCLQKEPFYFPFSLVFAAGAATGNQALGWNLTGLISLWLSFWMAWLLARRYAPDDGIAIVAALIAIALPFRWVNLLGGSPMGFAMLWVPALALGLDLAIRDRRVGGGLLAGTAFLFASFTDQHVFVFSALLIPCWGIVALLQKKDFRISQFGGILELFKPLSPLIVGGILALIVRWLTRTGLTESAKLGGARTLEEVALFSPHWQGLWSWTHDGRSGFIYLGYTLAAILLVGLVLIAWRRFGRRETSPNNPHEIWIFLLLLAGMVIAVLLALGTNGPFQGRLFMAVRKLIPPYAMIRQPAKIYCLMPTLLTVASAIALGAILRHLKLPRLRVVCLLVAILLLGEFRPHIRPALSRLDRDNSAYAAIAAQASVEGRLPRALAIPLWPGDSHWSSLYEYYASLYRIRMVNGYSPAVKKSYIDDVFWRFESVNKGYLSDEQLDDLSRRGIRGVILHEGAFPEKVSPFPVAFTLRNLLENPRLALLGQTNGVWAFGIVDTTSAKGAAPGEWQVFFPARTWEMEKARPLQGQIIREGPRSDGAMAARLEKEGDSLQLDPVRIGDAPGLRWMVRARGPGTVRSVLLRGGKEEPARAAEVQGADWTWIEIPVDPGAYAAIGLRLQWLAGRVDLDKAVLTAGIWKLLQPGESVSLPAPLFFHAGYTDLRNDAVVLDPDRDPSGEVFYGLNLPLPRGTYNAELGYSCGSQPIFAGHLVEKVSGPCRSEYTQKAGISSRVTFTQPDNQPVKLTFRFAGTARTEIKSVTLTRVQ